jgi:malic enzyme
MLGKVASAIGDADGTIGAVDQVQVDGDHTIRDITVETGDASDWPRLTEVVNAVPGARVLDATDRTFLIHIGGKIEVTNRVPVKTRDDLSMAYTPGVARVCQAIYQDPDKAFQYTIKRNTVAVVSDGTAVLGIGVSGAKVMSAQALLRMNTDPIVFAMANPTPEVAPEKASRYVRIMATGRSDYPNQINNVLCFPGIFRGALDVRATQITEQMKTAAARAIASIVTDDQLREDYIIPSVFNRDVAPAVAAAVAEQARLRGTAEAGAEIGFATAEDYRILPSR